MRFVPLALIGLLGCGSSPKGIDEGPDAAEPIIDADPNAPDANPDGGGQNPPGTNARCGAPPAGVEIAFPCAEGFGAVAKGGRGGDVYHVTNLNDSGAGSLREGIRSASGPRTIVFDIGGTIRLQSTLVINKNNITIAGQTAPGGGITLRDYSLDIRNTKDVVVRFIRIRRGDVLVRPGTRPTGSGGLDSVSIDDSSNIIFDHVSVSWSCDELFGIVQNKNVTVQWSFLAEPLGDPLIHPYGDNHAFGMNNSATTLSIHHNVIAKYVMRGPQLEANDATNNQGYNVAMEVINNLIYDYERSGTRYTTGIETNPGAASQIDFHFHILNNLYARAPNRSAPEIQAELKHGVSSQVKVHVAGNIGPTRDSPNDDPWLSVQTTDGDAIASAPANVKAQRSNTPLFTVRVPVTTFAANLVSSKLLRDVGDSHRRDSVDTRIASDISNRVFKPYLNSQSQVGGWPALEAGTAPTDTDRDGMPDAWETANGLDPQNEVDGAQASVGSYYTNLEVYLESLVPGYQP